MASASGKRLLLSGAHTGDRYRVGTLTLRPQAPSSLLLFGDGWHQPENVTATYGGSRWTTGRASLTFHNPRQDAVLYLRVAGRPDLFATPQQVSVMVDRRIVGRFTVASPEPQDYDIPLTAGDLGVEDDTALTLAVDKTFVPAEQPGGSADRRVLGVLVYRAFLEPRP
jgi:hypothetical protein